MTMSTNTKTDEKTLKADKADKRADEADLDQEVGVPSSDGDSGPAPCADKPEQAPSKSGH